MSNKNDIARILNAKSYDLTTTTNKYLYAHVFQVEATLSAKSKLAHFMSYKPITDISLSVGDLVDIYTRLEIQKSRKCSSPRSVLAFDRAAWTVSVPVTHGRTMSAAIEDVR